MGKWLLVVFLSVSSVGPAFATSVYVKYRGYVDLGPFQCQDISRSSLIFGVCYDARNSYMLTNVGGTWYHYCGVPREVVTSFMRASSMGRHYQASIKGRYDCRITPPPSYGN